MRVPAASAAPGNRNVYFSRQRRPLTVGLPPAAPVVMVTDRGDGFEVLLRTAVCVGKKEVPTKLFRTCHKNCRNKRLGIIMNAKNIIMLIKLST